MSRPFESLRFALVAVTLAVASCKQATKDPQALINAAIASAGSDPTAPYDPNAPIEVVAGSAIANRGVDSAAQIPENVSLTSISAHFLAFGDSGVGTPDQFRVGKAMHEVCGRLACDFAIHTGDIIYPVGVQTTDDPQFIEKFEKPYALLDLPIYLSLGNHDYYGNPDAAVDYALKSPSRHWILPTRYYTFVRGGVRFIAIDTNVMGERQAVWLQHVLADSRRFRELWVVVYGHHPRQSYGAHGAADKKLAAWLDKNLCWRADLYVAGHEHDKQVLKPRCGVHQLITGASAMLRQAKGGDKTVFAKSTLGFTWFEADGAKLAARFFDDTGAQEYEQVYERRSAESCGGDGVCNGQCPVDLDCSEQICAADGRCNQACTDDPDCAANCECDRLAMACDVRAGDLPCGCDGGCIAGLRPCSVDGECDPKCSKDPDCK